MDGASLAQCAGHMALAGMAPFRRRKRFQCLWQPPWFEASIRLSSARKSQCNWKAEMGALCVQSCCKGFELYINGTVSVI